MKKLLQRVFGVVVSAALLVTSGMTAFADDIGHSHRADDEPITSSSGGYTITLTTPESYPEINAGNSDKFSYGAYQIFTGTVKGEDYTTGDKANPGSSGTQIPITDIKWGNAFGIVDSEGATQESIDKAIVGFVIALAEASSGKYSYAFSDFNGFDVVQGTEDADADKAFIKKGTDDKTYLADRFVADKAEVNADSDAATLRKVNFDKLAVAVADVLVAHTDHEWLQAFNDILGGFGQGTGDVEGAYANPGYVSRYYGGEWETDYNSYKIENVPAGYYMILDRTGIADGDTDEAYSARMLFVVNNVTQVLKEDIPTLEKNVVRDDNLYETEAAGVGDDVKFRLTGTLPDNYDLYLGGYKYIFTDKLSKGLTLKPLETGGDTYVTVKVKNVYDAAGELVKEATGEYPIDKTTSFTSADHPTHKVEAAYTEDYTDNVLTVTFPCLKEIKIIGSGKEYYIGADSEIYIDYTAVVNENAIVSPADGNENTAVLEYSDNPQSYGDTDNTTVEHAKVYTFGLDIVKVDAAEYLRTGTATGTAALEGAKFAVVRPVKAEEAITGWEIAKFTTIDATAYGTMNPKPIDSFKEGYYSIVSWETLTLTGVDDMSKFDVKWLDIAGNETYKTGTEYNIATLEGGFLNISGLDDGVTYTIAETTTPTSADYAKINPFTITLEAAKDAENKEYTGLLKNATSPEDTTASFSFDKPVDIMDTFTGESASESDGSANMLVANFKYVDLPSTGGVGTYWFYILGAGGLAISFVLFRLSKKKIVQ